MTPDVKPLIAGNWKMNGTREALAEIRAIANGIDDDLSELADIVICPPSTLLYVATTLVEDSNLMIGAQDCHPAESGAHTGDISAEMIADCEAEFCIVGHSERRTDHSEDDATVKAKAEACLRADLSAIVCIGETEAEYLAGEAQAVLARQLAQSVPEGGDEDTLIIAYEPVWAIGTGRTPTLDEIASIHAFIRKSLKARFGEVGEGIAILYGGSVKPGNAAKILAVENVDGALVGGASLKASDFLAICKALETLDAD